MITKKVGIILRLGAYMIILGPNPPNDTSNICGYGILFFSWSLYVLAYFWVLVALCSDSDEPLPDGSRKNLAIPS